MRTICAASLFMGALPACEALDVIPAVGAQGRVLLAVLEQVTVTVSKIGEEVTLFVFVAFKPAGRRRTDAHPVPNEKIVSGATGMVLEVAGSSPDGGFGSTEKK